MRATPRAETESRTAVLNARNARAGLGLDGLARRSEIRQMACAPGRLRAACTALRDPPEGNSLSKRGSYGRGMAENAAGFRTAWTDLTDVGPTFPGRRRRL